MNYVENTFADWPAELHREYEQVKRIQAARKIKDADVSFPFLTDDAAAIQGSGAEPYKVTLRKCSCPDFAIQAKSGHPAPCKHMYWLAIHNEEFDPFEAKWNNYAAYQHLTLMRDTVQEDYDMARLCPDDFVKLMTAIEKAIKNCK